ncbi:hypothetical protein V8C34DRAFT_273461, partial [Trichoderma compactum]
MKCFCHYPQVGIPGIGAREAVGPFRVRTRTGRKGEIASTPFGHYLETLPQPSCHLLVHITECSSCMGWGGACRAPSRCCHLQSVPATTTAATMSAFLYQPLLLVNSDAFLVWDTPNSTSRPPFPLDSRHSTLCLLSSHFTLAGSNIHPILPPQPTKGIDYEIYCLSPFALFPPSFSRLVQTYYSTITACISSCTHCLLQVSASCGATARQSFESPSPILLHACGICTLAKRGAMKMEAISSTRTYGSIERRGFFFFFF